MGIQIDVPAEQASRSKMTKKGWKCWALRVTAVRDGRMPWDGDRLEVGCRATVEAGDVILHVDDSSDCILGVVVPAPAAGEGWIEWVQTAARADMLTAAGKRLLADSPAERIAQAVRAALKDPGLPADEREHYESMQLAGDSRPAPSEGVDLSTVSTDALLRELARRGVTVGAGR